MLVRDAGGGIDVQQYRLGEGPYGSAYRGTISDLFDAGDLKSYDMQGRSFGLFLGHFPWQQSIKQTWQEPAKGILAWLSGERVEREHVETVQQFQDLRFTGDQHHLIVASSGAGKFRDVISNMLLYDGSCETACLIIDPKGEIASTLGPIIDAPGDMNARTVILDPWNLTGAGRTDSLTLLDGIRLDNPHCVKDARVLAEAIIVERGSEDGHWTATAKNFLAAVLLYLGLDDIEKDERTLFRLRQIVTQPWSVMADMLAYMGESKLFEGLIARAATAMLNRDEKERRAILSTLERDTAFIEDPGLWGAIKTSSFDINQLVLSNKRLHVIVPFDYTEQMSSWLRLTIAAFYNACLRNQLPSRLPKYLQFRHIIIDEFPSLGKLDFIMKGIAEARGAGIKYHLVVQNFPQLNQLYREGWENLVSNSFVHAFGINDNFTAEYLSKLTGQATVVTESRGVSESTTEGTSHTSGSSSSSGGGGSSGTSSSTTKSFSTTSGTSMTFATAGRPVLMPDEIRRIAGYQQLLFLRELPVFLTQRTPYFQVFQHFLPNHSLRDVLTNRLTADGKNGIVPFGGNLGARTRLGAVNSIIRGSEFTPPPFVPYTFWEALAQSPGVVISAAGVLCLGIWLGVAAIKQSSADAAYSEHMKVVQEQQAEAAREAAKRAAAAQKEADAREAQARAVDATMTPSYVALASSVANTLGREGVCLSSMAVNPAFSCATLASYGGSINPIQFDLSARRQTFMTFTLMPQNVKRGNSFTGAAAQVTVKSVFDRVEINGNNETRFPAALRQALFALVQAFKVPDQVTANCLNGTLGQPVNSNGTIIACAFAPRPSTSGGLSSFTVTLNRAM